MSNEQGILQPVKNERSYYYASVICLEGYILHTQTSSDPAVFTLDGQQTWWSLSSELISDTYTSLTQDLHHGLSIRTRGYQ